MATADSVLNLPGDIRMLDVVRTGLAVAEDVRIAVSFTRCSGLGLLVDPLREVGVRGGRVRVLTSTYQAVTQPEALETLRRPPGVETRLQEGPPPRRRGVGRLVEPDQGRAGYQLGVELPACWR